MEQESVIQPNIQNKNSVLPKVFLLIFLIIGFIIAFTSGYFLRTVLSSEEEIPKEKQPLPTTLPNDTGVMPNTPEIAQDTTKFLPGKFYFDDTLIAITKDTPHQTIAASVRRIEQNGSYSQKTGVSYFNGDKWTRLQDSKNTPNPTIVSNSLITRWITNLDPSRVLKESDEGEFTVNKTKIAFSTGELQNEISVRSLPGYTKFLSVGNGTLTIDGQTYEAYILYTRIYSLNASDIQFYNEPLGLTTDWLAFWDTEGNFYHADATQVNKPTPIYQTHQLGILELINGAVLKTFQLSINRDAQKPPVKYTITLGIPLSSTLTLNRINAINKAPNNAYTWFMGNVEGSVIRDGETLRGVGLIEYIHH